MRRANISRRRGGVWRRTRLGVRLACLSVVLTAGVVTSAFALLGMRVRATTRALVAGQVAHAQRTLVQLQRRGDQQLVAAAALTAANPNLRSALGTSRVEGTLGIGGPGAGGVGPGDVAHAELARTVGRELERLAPDLDRDLVATTDDVGRIFVAYAPGAADARTSDETPRAGADVSGLPAVHAALDPALDGSDSRRYLSVLRVGRTYYRVGVAPIVLDGLTIGTVILGDRLDAPHLAALQRTFGGDLVVTAGARTLQSTLRDAPGASAAVASDRHPGEDDAPHPAWWGGAEYMVASVAVGATQDGIPVRLTLIEGVTPALRQTMRALLVDFAGCGLVAVALAGLGAALLARTVLGPLEAFVRLLRTSDGATAGGLVDPARSGGAVEIRSLHVSFARLMRAVARKQSQLAYQAYRDPLTGLANRAAFRDRTADALARDLARTGVTVLVLDLDHFKSVNDALGHATGDRLLCDVARRLRATCDGHTVARLGGDEFAVLVEGGTDNSDVTDVVERVLAALRRPVTLDGAELLAVASVGVARATERDGPDELLRNADVAMYRAKQQGRDGHAVFAPAMHAALLDRLALEADLRRALATPDAELRVVYQPIVALDTERPVGAEALVRWHHPTRGLVSPAQFIPLAEATGLVVPLGRWVLRTACRQARTWEPASGPEDGPYVSVNLSGRQLEDAGIVTDVADALTDAGIAPGRLLLEITESVVMHRADAALRTLHALKALGVRIAIDDFGTGYSSLAYLRRFPVDVLKVDKAFVDGVAEGGPDAKLTVAIVGLAATLDVRCVAEGIEHASQAAALRAAGCGYGQGYHFARPLAAADAAVLLMPASDEDPKSWDLPLAHRILVRHGS